MHPQDSSARPEASNLDKDRQVEFGILGFLLGEHPAQLTEAEVVDYRGGLRTKRAATFGETDEVERAVGQLVGAGLVRRQGESVISVGELMEGIAWVPPESPRGEFVISDSHRAFSKVTPRWVDEPSA